VHWRRTHSLDEEFEFSKVGLVSTISSGVGFPKDRQGKTSGDFPFAKVGNISRAVAGAAGRLSTASNYVGQENLASLRATPVSQGSTVFAKIGEALRLNRRAITAVSVILDNNCMALTPIVDEVRPAYLYYFMQTVDLSPFAVATAVPSVRRGDVGSLQIFKPTHEEQDKIIRRIETAFAWLDNVVAQHARADHLLTSALIGNCALSGHS
jgi:type I restriction enzyme, S subunit